MTKKRPSVTINGRTYSVGVFVDPHNGTRYAVGFRRSFGRRQYTFALNHWRDGQPTTYESITRAASEVPPRSRALASEYGL